MSRYKRVEKTASIGNGAYGVVYKAIDLHNNTPVALKKIKLEVEIFMIHLVHNGRLMRKAYLRQPSEKSRHFNSSNTPIS